MKIEIGQLAPDFSLYDSAKNKVQLADFKGTAVLLLFFPQAFTSVCTTELCAVRDDIARYQTAKVNVLGISVDSVFTLNKYKEDQNLNFPLLSDFNKKTAEAYGCLYTDWILDMQGVAKRSAFLIDKEGIIQYAEVLENAGEVPDFDKINQNIAAL